MAGIKVADLFTYICATPEFLRTPNALVRLIQYQKQLRELLMSLSVRSKIHINLQNILTKTAIKPDYVESPPL